MILQHDNNCSPAATMSHPKGKESSSAPLQKPQILQQRQSYTICMTVLTLLQLV